MIANLAFGCLLIAFLVGLYAIGAAIYGARMKSEVFIESARLASVVTFPLVSLAVLVLIGLMLAGHFEYTYVYRVISLDMPVYLKITALWGGQAGSLLFWIWLLTLFAAEESYWGSKKGREFLPWVIVVTMTTLVFFLFMTLFIENPFERIWLYQNGQVVTAFVQPYGAYAVYPPNGVGLNPLLRHPGMIIHPPLLYLGFVSFVVPFSYAAASLITGRTDEGWLHKTRQWTLVCWMFLSAGLVLGSRWAYDVLGWGGYWGWDPVEIAALMPWLTCTAFLHSAMMQQRRGLFKRWNYVLIVLTFCLVIFGTFLTRSGVLSSVHAFAQSAIGPVFFVFISLTFLVSLGLLLWRWNSLASAGSMRSFFSRESLFLFNNLIFTCIFLICLTGVLFPVFSEIITGHQVTVGPQWYKATTGPLFAVLLLLMGIVPLSIWGASTARTLGKSIWKPALVSLLVPLILIFTGIRTWGAILALWLVALVILVTVLDYGKTVWIRSKNTGENPLRAFWCLTLHNRHRYGGYVIHIGIVLMALGVIGIEFFQTQTQVTIPQSGKIELDGYVLRLDSLTPYNTADGRRVIAASLMVSHNGKEVTTLQPRRDYYTEAQQTVTVPGLLSNLTGDLYVVLVDWQPATAQTATFKVFHNPLIGWFWIGALVVMLGGLTAFWPEKLSSHRD